MLFFLGLFIGFVITQFIWEIIHKKDMEAKNTCINELSSDVEYFEGESDYWRRLYVSTTESILNEKEEFEDPADYWKKDL